MDDYTPLHLAAQFNPSVDVTRALLRRGADPDATGNRGITPLHLAAIGGTEPAVFTLLLAASDDPGGAALSHAGENPQLKESVPFWELKQRCHGK